MRAIALMLTSAHIIISASLFIISASLVPEAFAYSGSPLADSIGAISEATLVCLMLALLIVGARPIRPAVRLGARLAALMIAVLVAAKLVRLLFSVLPWPPFNGWSTDDYSLYDAPADGAVTVVALICINIAMLSLRRTSGALEIAKLSAIAFTVLYALKTAITSWSNTRVWFDVLSVAQSDFVTLGPLMSLLDLAFYGMLGLPVAALCSWGIRIAESVEPSISSVVTR